MMGPFKNQETNSTLSDLLVPSAIKNEIHELSKKLKTTSNLGLDAKQSTGLYKRNRPRLK